MSKFSSKYAKMGEPKETGEDGDGDGNDSDEVNEPGSEETGGAGELKKVGDLVKLKDKKLLTKIYEWFSLFTGQNKS